ncbi:hypothetical protein F4678DRAFT_203441 [Xylaria arbuscula]|nr:hypothetical protein F4678DRAFT_203441 [Xylaria arbuscula]
MVSFKLLTMSFGALTLPTAYATFIFSYCIDPNFENCHDVCGVSGQCIPVPTGLSSARAATGYNCYIYSENTACSGRNVGGPVTDDDRHYDLEIFGWNDITQSIQCEVA